MCRREESLSHTITIMQVEIEIHDARSPHFRGRVFVLGVSRPSLLREEHDPEHCVCDIAESACPVAHGMMPPSVPVDGDVRF